MKYLFGTETKDQAVIQASGNWPWPKNCPEFSVALFIYV